MISLLVNLVAIFWVGSMLAVGGLVVFGLLCGANPPPPKTVDLRRKREDLKEELDDVAFQADEVADSICRAAGVPSLASRDAAVKRLERASARLEKIAERLEGGRRGEGNDQRRGQAGDGADPREADEARI
jgi:hypothetical protein